jgi:putative transcriptional regulator
MDDKLFNDLLTSVKQAGAIMRGEMAPRRMFDYTPLDIKAIRGKLNKSQREFALMIGVSTSTLQNWEQGRRTSRGPARALLKVAEKNPQAVVDALGIW